MVECLPLDVGFNLTCAILGSHSMLHPRIWLIQVLVMKANTVLLAIFELSVVNGVVVLYYDAEAFSFIILEVAVVLVAVGEDNSAEALTDAFEEWSLVVKSMELHLSEAIVRH